MLKYKKYLCLALLIVFSFYATNKTAIMVRNKDPLMSKIKSEAAKINTGYVNAVIENDYITPGMYGKVVDELNSLVKMKENDAFNMLYLITTEVKPDVSLDDNKDKIIKEGNYRKKAVAFIIDDNDSVRTFLKNKNIKASILINKNSKLDSFFELINNDFNNYKETESLLKNAGYKSNVCLVTKNNYDICKKNKKYLIEPSIILENNIIEVKREVTSGSLIYIKSSTYLDILINYLQSKGLKIVTVSELISEKQ